MSSTECFDDVGCEAFILMDRREDGTEHYFVRKICKGLDGVRITYDLELDGQTPYTPLGEVLPVQTGSGTVQRRSSSRTFLIWLRRDRSFLMKPTTRSSARRHSCGISCMTATGK